MGHSGSVTRPIRILYQQLKKRIPHIRIRKENANEEDPITRELRMLEIETDDVRVRGFNDYIRTPSGEYID